MGEHRTTYQASYQPLRSAVTSDDSAISLTANGGAFSNKPSTAVEIVSPETNAVRIIFWGKDTDNDNFNFILYAYSGQNGPAERVCNGVVQLGTQDVVIDPCTGDTVASCWYCDTITISAQSWLKRVNPIDSGSNRVAKLCFDLCGYKWLYLEFDISGAAVSGTEINAGYAWF